MVHLPSVMPSAALDTLRRLAEGVGRVPSPACFVEVGVYQGGSASVLYDVACNQGRYLYLFDTFNGIPVAGPLDRHSVGDFADTNMMTIRDALPAAVLYVGLFPDTMPADPMQIAFAHIDCDQYASVKACITQLWPLMAPGGVMLFDDVELEGARAAIEEAFSPDQLQVTSENRWYVISPVV